MKKLTTTLLLLLSFALPVYADEFDDLIAEMRLLLDKCNDNRASSEACLDDTGRVSMSLEAYAGEVLPEDRLLLMHNLLLQIRDMVKRNTIRIESLESGTVATNLPISRPVEQSVESTMTVAELKARMNFDELVDYYYEKHMRRSTSTHEKAYKYAVWMAQRDMDYREQKKREFRRWPKDTDTGGTITEEERRRREADKFAEDKFGNGNNSAGGKRLP